MTSVTFEDLPLPPAAVPFVATIRVATCVDPGQSLSINVSPGGYPGLVWGFTPNGAPAIDAIEVAGQRITNVPPVFVHALVTEPSVMHFHRDGYQTIQLLFRPSTLRLMGIDPRLGNFGYAADLLAGGTDTTSPAFRELPLASRVESLVRAVLSAAAASGLGPDLVVEAAVEAIRTRPATASVARLATALGVSERTLERRFVANLGIGAKRFLRIVRAQAAVALIQSGRYSRLTDVALALNFYDQSHFIRDLRHFTFLSPKGIGDPMLDFHRDQNGLVYR